MVQYQGRWRASRIQDIKRSLNDNIWIFVNVVSHSIHLHALFPLFSAFEWLFYVVILFIVPAIDQSLDSIDAVRHFSLASLSSQLWEFFQPDHTGPEFARSRSGTSCLPLMPLHLVLPLFRFSPPTTPHITNVSMCNVQRQRASFYTDTLTRFQLVHN